MHEINGPHKKEKSNSLCPFPRKIRELKPRDLEKRNYISRGTPYLVRLNRYPPPHVIFEVALIVIDHLIVNLWYDLRVMNGLVSLNYDLISFGVLLVSILAFLILIKWFKANFDTVSQLFSGCTHLITYFPWLRFGLVSLSKR